MSVSLFSDHGAHVECSVEPQSGVCTADPLLPSPPPSSATIQKLLPWSLQDDQDVSLHTYHVLKQSSWEIYKLVHSSCGDFLD